MSGKIIAMGLRAAPVVNISATIPIIAATITRGSSLVTKFPGVARGMSGGGWTLTSPLGARGASRRALRTKRTVLTFVTPGTPSAAPYGPTVVED